MKKTILIVLALAGFAVQNGAADGGGFADFRKQQQARLLAAIDSTLATQAENAITGNFAAVKQADVQLQTELGGRKGNFGINLIGAIDESADSAFGWQLQGYVGPDSVKGANAGTFYRRINNGMLFGANAFLDYEDGDYGGFSRFGIGGEVEHKIVALAANYYMPLTDEKNVNSSVIAFSRQGFDAKLRVSPPQFDAVKLAVDYYNFDGERGAKSDDGLRYGVELHPFAGFRLDVLYDDGNEKFGGNIAYSHTIGERQTRQNDEFAPDMFAAVSREYSQRIATVAITAAPILTTPPDNTSITIMTMRTMITMRFRVASVQFSAEYHEINRTNPIVLPITIRRAITTHLKMLVTLPPVNILPPYVLTVMRDLAVVFAGAQTPPVQSFPENIPSVAPSGLRTYTISVTEGSEDIVREEPVITTLTTFSTMTITLGDTSAMGDISPNLPQTGAAFGVLLNAPRTFSPPPPPPIFINGRQ